MKHQKLWHSFALIITYLPLTAVIAAAGGILFQGTAWWIPFTVACILWVASLIFTALGTKHNGFLIGAFLSNALGAGVAISAYTVGIETQAGFAFLLTLAIMAALTFLVLILLLSLTSVSMILYTVVSYLVWLAGAIAAAIFVFPTLIDLFGIALPERYDTYVFFFLLLLSFLGIGSLLSADDFFDLLGKMIIPLLVATFLLLVIVLVVFLECDDCGCDGCGSGDCCDCSPEHNPTNYRKRSSTNTMSHMSAP